MRIVAKKLCEAVLIIVHSNCRRSPCAWPHRRRRRCRLSDRVSASAGVPKTARAASSNSPSQRATTTVARQLPITFTQVRPMSINSSTPKMTATPIGPSPDGQKTVQGREQNDERRTRHAGHAFGSEHEREHHRKLLTERHVPSHGRLGCLRHEHGSHRQVERRAVRLNE